MSPWLWVVVAFLAGGLVGAGITALLKRGSDVEQRMRRLRREYEQYQAEVARHFSQTGELLSRLRTAFDQLYNEVEDRATALVAEEALQRRLDYLDNSTHPSGGSVAEPAGPPRRLGDDRTATPGFGATAHAPANGSQAMRSDEDGQEHGDASPAVDAEGRGDEDERGS